MRLNATSTGSGEPFVTVLTKVATLLFNTGSVWLANTRNKLVSLPATVGCTTIWTELVVSTPSEPRFTSSTPPDGTLPPVAETKVTLTGTRLLTTTPAAAEGPALLTRS